MEEPTNQDMQEAPPPEEVPGVSKPQEPPESVPAFLPREGEPPAPETSAPQDLPPEQPPTQEPPEPEQTPTPEPPAREEELDVSFGKTRKIPTPEEIVDKTVERIAYVIHEIRKEIQNTVIPGLSKEGEHKMVVLHDVYDRLKTPMEILHKLK